MIVNDEKLGMQAIDERFRQRIPSPDPKVLRPLFHLMGGPLPNERSSTHHCSFSIHEHLHKSPIARKHRHRFSTKDSRHIVLDATLTFYKESVTSLGAKHFFASKYLFRHKSTSTRPRLLINTRFLR